MFGLVGFQGNNSLDSCSLSETVFILVTLPMSKAEFLSVEAKYIESVAITAGVVHANVKILSVKEISTRMMALRLLLATSVSVQTSVLLDSGQQTHIGNQTVLNTNLNRNGLPSSVLVAQNVVPSLVNGSADVSTPVPIGSGSNAPIGIVAGCVGGAIVLAVCAFLAHQHFRVKPPGRARWSSSNKAGLDENKVRIAGGIHGAFGSFPRKICTSKQLLAYTLCINRSTAMHTVRIISEKKML